MARRTSRRAAASGRPPREPAGTRIAPSRSRSGSPADRRSISASQYSSSRRRPVGGMGQSLANRRVPFARPVAAAVVADAVAGEPAAGIGRIFPPGDTALAQEVLHLGAVDSSSGRTMPSLVTGRMPARPAVPEPRRKRKRTVSAWSERVWPRATRSTPAGNSSRKKASRASRAACSRLPEDAATLAARMMRVSSGGPPMAHELRRRGIRRRGAGG